MPYVHVIVEKSDSGDNLTKSEAEVVAPLLLGFSAGTIAGIISSKVNVDR